VTSIPATSAGTKASDDRVTLKRGSGWRGPNDRGI